MKCQSLFSGERFCPISSESGNGYCSVGQVSISADNTLK